MTRRRRDAWSRRRLPVAVQQRVVLPLGILSTRPTSPFHPALSDHLASSMSMVPFQRETLFKIFIFGKQHCLAIEFEITTNEPTDITGRLVQFIRLVGCLVRMLDVDFPDMSVAEIF